MNIRVDLNTPINDGTEVVFRSPVDCSQITGLIVYYNGESKEFAFADAHGNNVGDIDHLFAENVVVKVILDVTTGMAFVQNADTNAYLEQRFRDLEKQIGKGNTPETDHSAYFDITSAGVVSLKAEYQNGGNKNAELPETIIIPDLINGIAVTALSANMFSENKRVKSITIPNAMSDIPSGFANGAWNLEEINGTENVETIGRVAFQSTSIKKALFPKLKEFTDLACFNNCVFLTIVDIGNTVTTIPTGCFNSCESLSLVLGGASVTKIGDKAFCKTRSLKNLPFVSNVKSIGKEAFVLSRVNFDWWNTSFSNVGANGTPVKWNATKWWEFTDGYTPTACENPLGSMFKQDNPKWADIKIQNHAVASNPAYIFDTYGNGCVEISAAHIYSALTGVKFDSPMFFVDNIVGGIEGGSLLTSTGTEKDDNNVSGPAYSFSDMANWLTALDMQCEVLTSYNKTNLQQIYDALKEGALILTGIYPGHAGVIYGVASNGEVLVLDSDPSQHLVGVYEARTFQQPIWSLVTSGTGAVIVRNRKVV